MSKKRNIEHMCDVELRTTLKKLVRDRDFRPLRIALGVWLFSFLYIGVFSRVVFNPEEPAFTKELETQGGTSTPGIQQVQTAVQVQSEFETVQSSVAVKQ